MWTHYLVDTITGDPLAPIFPSQHGWGRTLNVASQPKQTVFELSASDVPKHNWDAITQPWTTSIVTCLFDHPIYWGVLTGSHYARTSKRFTLKHSDMRALLARRYTFGTNGYSGDIEDGKFPLLDKTLWAIAAWLIESGTTLGFSPNYLLPFRLTEGDSVGPHSRTYFDFNFTTLEEGLQELQNMPGGPDIEFDPRRDESTGKFYLQMRTGTPELPSNYFGFHLDSAEPGIHDFERTVDGANQANVMFAIGTGSEIDMQVRSARYATTVPALESQEEYKGKDDGIEVLQDHADADLAAFRDPTQQWTGRMFAAGVPLKRPGLTDLALGDTIGVTSYGDPILADGTTDMMVVGLDGDLKKTFVPTLQVIGGA